MTIYFLKILLKSRHPI